VQMVCLPFRLSVDLVTASPDLLPFRDALDLLSAEATPSVADRGRRDDSGPGNQVLRVAPS
jgi:hypothetical protein